MDARALRADAQEDHAAEAIQGAWRWRIRRWERRLALEYLQETARTFVGKLRSGQRARKHSCANPATLFFAFSSYISHTHPGPVTERISAIKNSIGGA